MPISKGMFAFILLLLKWNVFFVLLKWNVFFVFLMCKIFLSTTYFDQCG